MFGTLCAFASVVAVNLHIEANYVYHDFERIFWWEILTAFASKLRSIIYAYKARLDIVSVFQ